MDTENKELLLEFVQDGKDMLEDIEVTLLSLNADDDGIVNFTKDDIDTMFRAFHSIKGGAGFLLLDNVKEVSHSAENLLDMIRSAKIPFQSNYIEILILSSDFVKDTLDVVSVDMDDKRVTDQAEVVKNIIQMSINEVTGDEFSENISENEEFVNQYISESEELLKSLEADLLSLDKKRDDGNLIDSIFRKIHTLKGNSGFLGFNDSVDIYHALENVIDRVKDDKNINVKEVVQIFLRTVDLLFENNKKISDNKGSAIEGKALYIELISELIKKNERSSAEKVSGERKIGEILIEKGVVSDEIINEALDIQKRPLGKILKDMGAVSSDTIDEALNSQGKSSGGDNKKERSDMIKIGGKRQDIRVSISKLDSLINLIGELVITNNMLIHSPDIEGLELDNFTKAARQMVKIVRELQETAMTIRMIPITGLFKRMMRLVHDVANKSDKKVELKLSGEETEIDKTVIELITDPIVHIIRNSIDHGLEVTEERTEKGKSEKGMVKLTARHEEGEVWIEIEDDGRGIDRERVLNKGIENGLVTGDGKNLSDSEVFSLIFHPGFSTADKITDLSGRGVGMDVVKKNLEKINGKVDVFSTEGKGTRIVLRIPLTLAIIEGMLVEVGKAQFIIPLLQIKEFYKPRSAQITVTPDGNETVKIRDTLLPVMRLHKIYNITSKKERLEEGIIIVLESRKDSVALFVDSIIGQQQTVIKGLSEYIGRIKGISGCTILGDGDVSMIIDVDTLLQIPQDVNA